MRILFINQYYWPDVAATAQILTDLGDGLAKRGHSVSTICSKKSYLGEGVKLDSFELHNGVTIYRLPAFGGGKKASFSVRLIDFLSFYVLVLFKSFIIEKSDIVITLTTPPFVGMVGRFLQIFMGSRHIHWCMDIYPDIQIEHGWVNRDGILAKLMRFINRSFIGRADLVCVLGKHMKNNIKKYVVECEKIKVVPVWAKGDEVYPVEKADNWFASQNSLVDKFVVMYSGNIGTGSSFDTIFNAIKCLKSDAGIVFAFIGAGKQLSELKDVVKNNNLGNVLFFPYMERVDISCSLSAGDVHFVTIKPGLEGLKVPCKTYGILAAGRPILYLGGPDSEVADIINDNSIGYVINEGDTKSLVEAIITLKSDNKMHCEMCQKARSVFEKEYDADLVIDKMDNLIKEVVK